MTGRRWPIAWATGSAGEDRMPEVAGQRVAKPVPVLLVEREVEAEGAGPNAAYSAAGGLRPEDPLGCVARRQRDETKVSAETTNSSDTVITHPAQHDPQHGAQDRVPAPAARSLRRGVDP